MLPLAPLVQWGQYLQLILMILYFPWVQCCHYHQHLPLLQVLQGHPGLQMALLLRGVLFVLSDQVCQLVPGVRLLRLDQFVRCFLLLQEFQSVPSIRMIQRNL